jgi:hypothetical protein
MTNFIKIDVNFVLDRNFNELLYFKKKYKLRAPTYSENEKYWKVTSPGTYVNYVCDSKDIDKIKLAIRLQCGDIVHD